jgi:type I restriction enzyme S subunit
VLRSQVLLDFLGYYFRHFDFLPYITGTTRAKLTQRDLMRVELPVPPLPVQQRIVDTLNETDQLRELRAKADQRTADLIPALFHEMFGNPASNPQKWSTKKLCEIADLGSGSTPSKENEAYWNGKIPWVSPKDMKSEEILDTIDQVSDLAFNETNLQLVPSGTVLIVVRGMILTHTVPLCISRVPVAINQDMKAILPKRPIEPEFLRWCLQAQHSHLLAKVDSSTHGTRKLDSEKLRSLPIAFPPLSLQKGFAERVHEVRVLESSQAASSAKLESLSQSLLHRAFNGDF